MSQLVLDPLLDLTPVPTVTPSLPRPKLDFYEFFAGGGMARAGFGPAWRCLFANDFDHKKSRTYEEHWGLGTLKTGDVGALTLDDLPGYADVVWASFPCQDLSLAGAGAGLKGDRSGTFWPFWRLMRALIADNRGPSLIALENVCGALTSHDGKDFIAICDAIHQEGYRVGAVVIDASLFLPQSRARLFIIALRSDIEAPASLLAGHLSPDWHTPALRRAYERLPSEIKRDWLWWSLPHPRGQRATLASIIEDEPTSVRWHTKEETAQLLDMMTDLNRAKVEAAQRAGRPIIGGIYKRTRQDTVGRKIQRAEIRFDDTAGCLRTPSGGSSRQVVLMLNGPDIRSRLISSRETARLMGLPDEYNLPGNYNEAYHLTGDGVAVPVVRHLAENIFEPILADSMRQTIGG